MVRKILTIGILTVLVQALAITSAFGQDFGTLVSQASTANKLWVSQIDTALQATDLATLQAEASTALTTGQQVQSLLQSALPLAPDDASRSRVQGVLQHVTAAIQSGQDVASAQDVDATRSALNAERGEAQEALSELAPFATQVTPVQAVAASSAAAPVSLPKTGGVPLLAFLLGGGGSLLIGFGLRRRFA